MKEAWTEDWNSFVDHLATLVRDGATTETLKGIFGGRKVRWGGIVNNVNLDELAPSIDMNMPEIIVELGNGGTTALDGLIVPIGDDAIAAWSTVESGDRVLFEATIGSGNVVFPPIEVKTFDSGRSILMIRVHNGKLIERLNNDS